MTQAGLAAAIGIKHGTQVSQWERDENAPNAANLQMIADALGVSVRWLLNGDTTKEDLSKEKVSREAPDASRVMDTEAELHMRHFHEIVAHIESRTETANEKERERLIRAAAADFRAAIEVKDAGETPLDAVVSASLKVYLPSTWVFPVAQQGAKRGKER